MAGMSNPNEFIWRKADDLQLLRGLTILCEFRAGRMSRDGTQIRADPRKGFIRVVKAEDSLLRVQWYDAVTKLIEDNHVAVPGDGKFEKASHASERVYLLRFKSDERRAFYWMQGKNKENDKIFCDLVHQHLRRLPIARAYLDTLDSRYQIQFASESQSFTLGAYKTVEGKMTGAVPVPICAQTMEGVEIDIEGQGVSFAAYPTEEPGKRNLEDDLDTARSVSTSQTLEISEGDLTDQDSTQATGAIQRQRSLDDVSSGVRPFRRGGVQAFELQNALSVFMAETREDQAKNLLTRQEQSALTQTENPSAALRGRAPVTEEEQPTSESKVTAPLTKISQEEKPCPSSEPIKAPEEEGRSPGGAQDWQSCTSSSTLSDSSSYEDIESMDELSRFAKENMPGTPPK